MLVEEDPLVLARQPARVLRWRRTVGSVYDYASGQDAGDALGYESWRQA